MGQGAWEIPKSVLCAILHVEHVPFAWAMHLRRLQVPGPVIGLTGMPFDHARNAACQKALEIGVDFLYFVDSDVITPPDVIHRLMAHRLPIVSGLYNRRSPPAGVPVMIKNGSWVTTLPDPNKGESPLVEVDLVGAGCLLIQTSVLRDMPPQEPGKHWFNWQVDKGGTSEDFTFNIHAKKTLGISTYVDTSIRCKHIGLSEYHYQAVQPLDYNFSA